MKRIVLLVVVCLTCLGAFSQEMIVRSFDVKANLRSDFGIGVGMTMNVLAPSIDFAPSYNYYFRGNDANAWHLDGDFHYNFFFPSDVELYPLVGLTFFHCGKSYFGMNLGGGLTYNFSDSWALKSELKYQFVHRWDDLYFSVGFSYRF